MASTGERWLNTRKYCTEVREMLRNIEQAVTLGERPDPEDIVVLRGSTEALIELAEETND